MPDWTYGTQDLALAPGDVGVLVTDGVTEAMEAEEPLAALVRSAISGGAAVTAGGLCGAVMERARKATGPVGVPDWRDDRTVVAFVVG